MMAQSTIVDVTHLVLLVESPGVPLFEGKL
jgi:hypothetical protein